MTKDELDDALLKLKSEYDNAVIKAEYSYVRDNTKYKEGDIIKDHIGHIKIEKIKLGHDMTSRRAIPVYCGIELKKDLMPTKRQEHNRIWGNNIEGGWMK